LVVESPPIAGFSQFLLSKDDVMSFRGVCVGTVLALAGAAFSGQSARANPFASLIPFNKVESDPNKSYALQDSDGPWMIMAFSFAGEGAYDEAHRLAVELRKRHRLKAYTYAKHFDYTARGMQGMGIDRSGRPKRMKYWNEREFDEVAVLVGDYPSIEDPRLQKTLEKVKFARPACLDPSRKLQASQPFAKMRAFWDEVTTDGERKQMGPMRRAFATPNPVLPAEYFAPKGLDQAVVNMNRNVEHSLLNCSGKYTVRVATFRGNVVLDQKEIQEIEEKRAEFDSKLEEAAWKAHRLTELLRKQGVEAYEFHDRHESLVTVGSFNSLGSRGLNGEMQLSCDVQRVVDAFKPQPIRGRVGNMAQVNLQPKVLGGVPFDVHPVPIEVPRRSIATDYARRASLR
jgi:hypothetical protein